jgi:hypothetical protein
MMHVNIYKLEMVEIIAKVEEHHQKESPTPKYIKPK